MRNRTKPRTDTAFTLVELMVVTAIVLILYVLLLDPGSERVQNERMTRCAENLRQLHVALRLYAQDHAGCFPDLPQATSSEAPLSLLVPEYVAMTSTFLCPGSNDPPLPESRPFPDRKISYAYYAGHRSADPPDSPLASDEQLDQLPKRAGSPLFSPTGRAPGNNHRRFGGNILLLDGSVSQSEHVTARDLPCNPPVRLLNPRP